MKKRQNPSFSLVRLKSMARLLISGKLDYYYSLYREQKHFNKIRNFMMTTIGKTFNTQVLKISLNECEDRIASVIAAHYDVILDDEMI